MKGSDVGDMMFLSCMPLVSFDYPGDLFAALTWPVGHLWDPCGGPC